MNFADLRWTCHVCGLERPDRFISVYVTDLSSEKHMPPGTLKQNVRFCNDNPDCIDRAKTFRLIKPHEKDI